jgi:aspartate ammonia-lyase
LELNAFLPLIAHALLGNLALLERACTIFRERCIDGIQANAARCNELLERSHAQVTALVPALGYELAADVAKEAQLSQESIRTVVLARGLLAPQVLDRLLSADAMTALGYTKNDFKD